MSPDRPDTVSVYTDFQSRLRAGHTGLDIGMLLYFWARLARFNIDTGAICAEDHAKSITTAFALLERPSAEKAKRLARHAEGVALEVMDQKCKLMIVGYWSARSYFFYFINNHRIEFAEYTADVFLSALEDCFSEECPNVLNVELLNLACGYEMAESLTGSIVDMAKTISIWAAEAPIGARLKSSKNIDSVNK